MEFLTGNWEIILTAVLIPVATIIVKMTKTKKDDKALSFIVKVYNLLSKNKNIKDKKEK